MELTAADYATAYTFIGLMIGAVASLIIAFAHATTSRK